ncbi:hypothetical protein AB8U03_16745 [Clostridium sp. Mt-5]|uniref:Uncharacterized protein n=1 Tax=Clostridium moutaii TaxID=3240932 RepID=A0ABV4BVT6_9CLOT
MTNLNVLFIVLGLAVGVGSTVLILLPFLKKKGVNTADVLQKVDTGLQEVKKYTDAAKALVPGNKFLNILSVIEKYAEIGVGQAAHNSMYLLSSRQIRENRVQRIMFIMCLISWV